MGSTLGSTKARARIPMEDQKIRKYLFYLGILSRRNFIARIEYNKKIYFHNKLQITKCKNAIP